MTNRNVLSAALLTALLTSPAFAHEGPIVAKPDSIAQSHGDPSSPDTIISSPASTATNPVSVGKTRAEVKQELLQAHRDGLMPMSDVDYPPGQRTIERNKARFSAFERNFQ